MIVVDTNVISYLMLPGTHTAKAQDAFRKDSEWAAPLLWRSEFRNVLSTYLRRGQVSLEVVLQLMTEAEGLMSGREYEVPSERVFALASQSKCSAYDCEFVVLAQDLGVALVTSDSRVLRAFPDRAVSLTEFAAK